MMTSLNRGSFFRESWKVPRSIVCGMFWMAVFILFVGMILMVISKHKGRTCVIWGGVLLSLGFCLVLVCFLLCLNAYRILSQKNKLPQTVPPKFNLAVPPSPTSIVHSAPSSTRQLNYPHIFVPIYPPSSKVETSEEKALPASKSVFEKTVSFEQDSRTPGDDIFPDSNIHKSEGTPSRKKRVRLQNVSVIDERNRRGEFSERVKFDDLRSGKTVKSVPYVRTTSREECSEHFHQVKSAHDTFHPKHVRHKSREEYELEKMKNDSMVNSTSDNFLLSSDNRNAKRQWQLSERRPVNLTDDETQRKFPDRDIFDKTRHIHSKTLPQFHHRQTGDEILVESIGSMRVKVRPIRSRLYMPEWVCESGESNHLSTQQGDNPVNIIHF